MTWDRIHRLELELAEKDATIARLTVERDNARAVAVHLEQELAEVTA